jgi:hypothetical protein
VQLFGAAPANAGDRSLTRVVNTHCKTHCICGTLCLARTRAKLQAPEPAVTIEPHAGA